MSKTLRMILGLMVVAAPLALIGCDEAKKPETKPADAAAKPADAAKPAAK